MIVFYWVSAFYILSVLKARLTERDVVIVHKITSGKLVFRM